MKKKKNVFFTVALVIMAIAIGLVFSQGDNKQKSALSTDKNQNNETPSNFKESHSKENRPQAQVGPWEKPENKTQVNKLNESLTNFRKFCLEEYPEYEKTFPDVQTLKNALLDSNTRRLWNNTHLRNEAGEVYRVRRFIDDGQNAEFERLVLFKEDETGFPALMEIKEEHRKNPSKQIVEKYMKLGTPIFTDEAYGLDRNGTNYFFEMTKGDITRIDVTSDKDMINCQLPY